MVKDSNFYHNNHRKEEFHPRFRGIYTFSCGLTSILWRSQILEIILIDLNNSVKRKTMSGGGGHVNVMWRMCEPIFGTGEDFCCALIFVCLIVLPIYKPKVYMQDLLSIIIFTPERISLGPYWYSLVTWGCELFWNTWFNKLIK